MKRHRFILTGAATFGSITSIFAPARAGQFEYRLASSAPVSAAPTVRMVQMAAAVKAETNGRLEIRVYPAAQLGSASSLLGQLRLGSIQLMHDSHSGYSSAIPLSQITALGFAFQNSKQALDALDGSLGAYVRKEFAAKGIYVFDRTIYNGFRQITSSKKPIATGDDLVGLRIRVQPAPIFVDMFKTLGASPVPIDGNALYTALQTHLVDGEDNPLPSIQSFKLFEVQRYLSMTNHQWGGEWVAANGDAFNALPSDVQETLKRNISKFVLLERKDIVRQSDSIGEKLGRQGMIINTADTSGMRARLAPYYARWKGEFGNTAWSLLEDTVGKLG